jgi:conserved oligomeric Golgi complex subunit 6
MSSPLLNESIGYLDKELASPASLSPEAVSNRKNALASKLTKVLSQSYVDPEIRNALSILDIRGVVNDASTRRKLGLDIRGDVIECNGSIVQDFGLVADVCGVLFKM